MAEDRYLSLIDPEDRQKAQDIYGERFLKDDKLEFLAAKGLLPFQNDVASFDKPDMFTSIRRGMGFMYPSELQLTKRQQAAIEEEYLPDLKTKQQMAQFLHAIPSFGAAQQQNPTAFGLSGIQPPMTRQGGILDPSGGMDELGLPKVNMQPAANWNAPLAPQQAQAYMGAVGDVPKALGPRNPQPLQQFEAGRPIYNPNQGAFITAPGQPTPKAPPTVTDENRYAEEMFGQDFLGLNQQQKKAVNTRIQSERVELQRAGYEAKQGVPERVPDATRKLLTDERATFERFSEIGKLFKPEWVGVAAGRLGGIQEKYGGFLGVPELDPAQADFYTSIAAFNNKIINLLSGANVPPAEFERIVGELPRPEQPAATFKARLKQTEKNLRSQYSILKDVLKETGAQTGGIKDLPAKGQPAGPWSKY